LKKSAPLASIVIPIFNHAQFAVETVQSALDQTYQNVEIIVVDDGSTDDGALRVATRFADRVSIVRQRNLGPSTAVNAGVRAASGKYIVLLGGDDMCASDRVEHQIDILEGSRNDIVFCRPVLIDADSQRVSDDSEPVFFRTDVNSNIALEELFFKENFLCASTATVRAEVFGQLGKFHEGLIQLQDYEFWLRALAHGLRLRLFDRPVVSYRRHTRNLSSATRSGAAAGEMPVVLLRTLRQGTPSIIRSAFRTLLPQNVPIDAALSDFEVGLILLAHPRQEVRIRGLELVIDLMENSEFMQSTMGAQLNTFRFLYNSSALIK